MNRPVVKRNICILYCDRTTVAFCWRRKHHEPCPMYKNYEEQKKYEIELEKQRKSQSDWDKHKEKEILESDEFDRNSYDESDKNISESIYDEQMDVLLE